MIDLLTALGLVFVIEGAFLTLFPLKWKNFAEFALRLPEKTLRTAGLAGALFGFIIVSIARGL